MILFCYVITDNSRFNLYISIPAMKMRPPSVYYYVYNGSQDKNSLSLVPLGPLAIPGFCLHTVLMYPIYKLKFIMHMISSYYHYFEF